MKDMFNEMVAGHKEGPVTLRHPVVENAEEFIEKSRRSEKFHKGLVSPPVDLSAYTDY
ncbi:MAG: hypothetical protein HKN33_05620, partial [Pyrinomonadaceae bacterium]|nr:hypothetical protein [Pyrinomonadaceae bacterium]